MIVSMHKPAAHHSCSRKIKFVQAIFE